MKPVLQHGSRSAIAYALRPSFAPTTSNVPLTILQRLPKSSICLQCQFRTFSSRSLSPRSPLLHRATVPGHPNAGAASRWFADKPLSNPPESREPVEEPKTPPIAEPEPPTPTPQPSAKPADKPTDNIVRVQDKDLPSHWERKRWELSKKLSALMEDLQAKVANATHIVNNYTGTDYSGIEALRREIIEQEKLVKERRKLIDAAKQELDQALVQQASAQKEVVALLERKHSWSATDLERYMSLIRSEHVNEQAVQTAKEKVSIAEQNLEEARLQLEKRERMRYHEEQIWSDTIRRNSTWVTFGLMGFNIFILLASLVIIEPWRRRRLVREIKSALDEKAPMMAVASPPMPTKEVEAQIDSVVEPAGVPIEALQPQSKASPETSESLTVDSSPAPSPEQVQVSEDAPSPTAPLEEKQTSTEEAPTAPLEAAPSFSETVETQPPVPQSARDHAESVFNASKLAILDLFSDRQVSVRKVDLTTVAVESAILGASVCGLLVFLLRPN